jgi:hypothetical protein
LLESVAAAVVVVVAVVAVVVVVVVEEEGMMNGQRGGWCFRPVNLCDGGSSVRALVVVAAVANAVDDVGVGMKVMDQYKARRVV